jgi:hypothetical protein
VPKDVTIRHASLVLDEVTLPDGLKIDRLELDAVEIVVSGETQLPRSSRPMNAIAVMTETTLTEYLNAQLPTPIKKVEVTLKDGKVQVAAVAKVLFDIQALAICRMEIRDESELHVVLESLEPGGPVRAIVEGQLEGINPVLRAADLPLRVRLISADIDNGEIRVLGTASLEFGE